MIIRDIETLLQARAPFSTAMEWDNVGLLVGSATDPVNHVLVALDATADAVKAAASAEADLILTHHPAIFSPLRCLRREEPAYMAAAAGIGILSAHTNLDLAQGGVNDTLAQRLGLTQIHPAADGLCRIGTLPKAAAPHAFARAVAETLGAAVRINDSDRPIRTVAVCGGSGGDCIPALAGAVDAFVTGEVKHHEWLAANAATLTVLEAGHYATEAPVIDTLCGWLREAFPSLLTTPYYAAAPYTTITK